MEDYIRLFFQGEALQHLMACMCNGMQRGVQDNICSALCTMIQSTLCMRFTAVGLAPFKTDITMVLPYTRMNKSQLDFLQDVLSQATFNSTAAAADPIKAIGYGSEIVVITTLGGMRIWDGNSTDRPPLAHTFASFHHSSPQLIEAGGGGAGGSAKLFKEAKSNAAKTCAKGYGVVLPSGRNEKEAYMRNQAHMLLTGKPMGGSTSFQLDTLEVLKAFCACVFRSSVHKKNSIREGICHIVLQMVIGEIGITQDTLENLSSFIAEAKQIAT